MIPFDDITLFKSLFKGRDDALAIRWEKEGKSGYMPAYFFDPYRFKAHKMKGGTFQNYPDKTYLAFNDEQISKHLDGIQHIGIYPLLKDNTTWFVAADFDKENWIDQCRAFVKTCTENNISSYLERSRSGKGGHVWIFFEKPYPAIKSRKIFISLLERAGIFSVFDKSSSFDRLFPNQDFLSGKGFGNLIALPLHKKNVEQGNGCFVDIASLEPYKDQWDFLRAIKKNPIENLDELYQSLTAQAAPVEEIAERSTADTLVITLNKMFQ